LGLFGPLEVNNFLGIGFPFGRGPYNAGFGTFRLGFLKSPKMTPFYTHILGEFFRLYYLILILNKEL